MSIAAPRVAGASPASEESFRDGKALLKAGKLGEACESFARSQRLAPRVGTLLNLADCRERQGLTATAWSLFRESISLASQTNDKRAAEATRRAASLEPKLAYLTLQVAPDRQVEGLEIKRNGTVVDPASWNQPVPLDPIDYVLEARAPTYQLWTMTQPLAPRASVSIEVELVPEPVAVVVARVPLEPAQAPTERTSDPPLGVQGPGDGILKPALPRKGRVPQLRSAGIGLALGTTGDDDPVIGGRIIGNVAVPGGALRGIGSVLYTNTQLEGINYLDDPSNTTSVYAFGLAADYVWMPTPRFAFAGGIGVGLDYLVRDLDQATDRGRWTTLRASPIIVRLLEGQFELGLHVQVVHIADNVVFVGVAAVDVFLL